MLAGGTVNISYTYKSSAVDTLNKVDLKTYDKNDGVVTTHSILSEGAAIHLHIQLIITFKKLEQQQ